MRGRESPERGGVRAASGPLYREQPVRVRVRRGRTSVQHQQLRVAELPVAELDRLEQQTHAPADTGQRHSQRHDLHDGHQEKHGRPQALQAHEHLPRGGGEEGPPQGEEQDGRGSMQEEKSWSYERSTRSKFTFSILSYSSVRLSVCTYHGKLM